MMPNDMVKHVRNNHDELNLGQFFVHAPNGNKKQDQKVGKGTQCFYQQ